MFFETLRFSRICVLKSCVPGLKSWRGGQVNVTLFFYTTHKQVLQIVPMHVCWPMHDILGGGGGVAKASTLTVDGRLA